MLRTSLNSLIAYFCRPSICCQAHLQGQKAGAAAAGDVPEVPGQAVTQLGHQIALHASSARLFGMCAG